ncbi:MAG: Clp protease N-terminal domain-containing protein [Vulcanimicrobiaceae bacterium]
MLRLAEQECRNHNHYYVGVEHMLFALIEEQDSDVEAALREEQIATGDVYTELKRALGTGEDRVWEGILITPRMRSVVRNAEARVGERNIEPVDLYRAIRDERGGIAADVLERLAASR